MEVKFQVSKKERRKVKYIYIFRIKFWFRLFSSGELPGIAVGKVHLLDK